MFIIAMLIFLVMTASIALLLIRSTNENVHLPSIMEFERLFLHYSSTLTCPCSQLTIPYETFATVKIQFHQVCSSQFVSQMWIESVFENQSIPTLLIENDIRTTFSAFWHTIADFCHLTQASVNAAVARFSASSLLSSQARSKVAVLAQTNGGLNSFISEAASSLTQSLRAIQSVTIGNQFVSGLLTNFYINLAPSEFGSFLILLPKTFDNCSCLTTQGCSRQSTFNFYSNRSSVPIPGLKSDCLIVNGVLKSSLECYYDEICINQLHGSIANVNPLSKTGNRYFMLNSTIQQILDKLMIDEVLTDVTFDKYYAQCNPKYCSYIAFRRFNLFFAMSTLIGAYGGLSLVLRIIIPRISKQIMRRKKRSNQDQTLDSPQIQKESKLTSCVISYKTVFPTYMTSARKQA